MGKFQKIAEQKAKIDFRELNPGVAFDRTNDEHIKFMREYIEIHEKILEDNEKRREVERHGVQL